MSNLLEQDTWLDTGVFLEPVSDEGRKFWACCVELGKKHNIHLPSATDSQRAFIIEQAEKLFYGQEAV